MVNAMGENKSNWGGDPDLPTTIGVLGTGNMGSALVKGWLRSGDRGVRLVVWDKIEASMQRVLAHGPVSAAGSLEDLVARSDAVLVVVKPKDAPEVLGAIAPLLREGQSLISAMAGVTLEQMRLYLGSRPRLFRVMPNLGVELGAGVIAVTAERGLPAARIRPVMRIFSALGVAETVPESMFDAVTAVSGSGPAFLALAAESLEDGAVASGLPRTTARRLVRCLALSAGRNLPLQREILAELNEDPEHASIQAASTDVLEHKEARRAFRQAIESAVERSKRLRDA
jgi:pyrroline-5-carboxylate reductase